MTAKDLLLGLFIIFAWGFNFVVIRLGLDAMTPMMLGGVRFLLLAVVGCFFFARPKTPLKWWIAYALTLNFGQFAFLFSAMIFGMPAGLASLVLQSQAIFTLLFSVLLLKEVVRPYQVLAIAVACGGLAIIGADGEDTSMTVIGFALTLAGASSWALGNIATKAIIQKGYQADLSLIVWSAWFAALPFFISSFFVDSPSVMWSNIVDINWSTLAILIYLTLVATLGGYGLWSYLMSRYSAGTVAPLSLGVPVVGLTSAAVVLGESISHQQWLGISVVLVGLLMNTFGGRLRRRQTH
ncbi:putative amino-acid metabolite efflux pump [Marinomonas gallaica]|uniref:Amino-acid metabolite efflux pump n=1 Tax=Marinomonas gallaica TaxID=1806667 RepID=A0A1C3JRL3_9GAMM|nr:EamA family transporter [Marinomonas gallaica]SBT17871.1 putative amino-acid metabolite efflux pump [Marinomonas gallaica]SBT22043.1 putative amino-acid metabolite efflux pump [Marinomonas gallaica]